MYMCPFEMPTGIIEPFPNPIIEEPFSYNEACTYNIV